MPHWCPARWVWFKRHVLLQIIVPSDFSRLTQDANVCLQSWTWYATPEQRNSRPLSGTTVCFHLSFKLRGGFSCQRSVSGFASGRASIKEKYIYAILLFSLLYCNLLYLCICKVSAIWKPVNVGTMLQKKTNQLLHLISWTNLTGGWNLYFGSRWTLMENVTCYCIFRTDF